jgi:hypothetical protein
MGNIASAKKDGKAQPFVIEYIARYVSITKTQFTDLRNRCYMDMDERRKINRQSFRRNVELCDIKENPDAEILDCLFTMWDMHGEDCILCPPFILSLAPLVCRDESFRNILKFSLSIFHSETKGILTADRTVFILKRKCDIVHIAEPQVFTALHGHSRTFRFTCWSSGHRSQPNGSVLWRFSCDTPSNLQSSGRYIWHFVHH